MIQLRGGIGLRQYIYDSKALKLAKSKFPDGSKLKSLYRLSRSIVIPKSSSTVVLSFLPST